MTIASGFHAYGFKCSCGNAASGYPSQRAAAAAERRCREHAPNKHIARAEQVVAR